MVLQRSFLRHFPYKFLPLYDFNTTDVLYICLCTVYTLLCIQRTRFFQPCKAAVLSPTGNACVALCCVLCLATLLCPLLCNTLDCSPPGYSVHGIFQRRILEWVAIFSSRPGIELSSLSSPVLVGESLSLGHLGSPL